ncbi:threonine--tRNA ligase [Patescibacteria group bacterium]|nr:threonine--tRNA ligase [Patescibacteria group bacterium]
MLGFLYFKIKIMSKNKKTFDLGARRHSCAHVLAQAVLEMFPEAKLAIGPSIEHGFYYDFDLPRTLIPEDLPLIEKKMKHIVKQAQKFEKRDVSIADAKKIAQKAGQDYKVEMISDLAEKGEKEVSFYENLDVKGDIKFVDMCIGPHIDHTGQVGAFKLTTIAGAYWKGDEKNKMLQRIYGVCFENQKELDEHLKLLDEAKKRDHRRLGKDLDLFSFHEEGPGFPFWHAKGVALLDQLKKHWYKLHRQYGYEIISTPIILNEDLWHRSGHWDNYKENMYFTDIDETAFAVKPMNCPGGMLVYKTRRRSYRDLPMRSGELGLVHRHEKSGVLHGLFRVRSFTQDDAHIFCREDQVKEELKKVMELTEKLYEPFGFKYHVELSTRPEKAIGSDEVWETSEAILKEIIEESGLEYQVNEGDGAFYGPKIDYHIKDCIGRTWQCGTIQLDFSMPERFDLEYTGEDGNSHRPIMIHRALYGSLERFAGVLIEHYGGAFPVWLAPVQARILPVSEKFMDYAESVYRELYDAGVRVEMDRSDESLGKKIRNAELAKVPYMLVIGEKEVTSKKIAVRDYETKGQEENSVAGFVKLLDS